MLLIGITGGVGAGKTSILDFISRHYAAEIYLADEVAKKLQEPGGPCYKEIVELLGRDILQEDGRIDKGKMAAKIFFNKNLLLQVNALIHPAVRLFLEEAAGKASQNGAELFFVEAALLIESGYGDFVDEMWYVYASEKTRRERLIKNRGYSAQKVQSIFANQLSEEQFRNKSNFVIDNSTTPEAAQEQIKKRLEAYTWRE